MSIASTALVMFLSAPFPPGPAVEPPAVPLAPAVPGELVVLVHGMGRTPRSMRPLEGPLAAAGYEVVNFGYPSREARVTEHGEALAGRLAQEEARPEVTRIHLVGHSLGNIVIRWVLSQGSSSKLGRVVMLAPPNQGARLADFAAPWLTWFSRPLPDLTTHADSASRLLTLPAGIEIGVIAGSYDHLVSPRETCLDGQTDHIFIPAGHSFIMRKPRVHELTRRFLATGSFGPHEGDAICVPASGQGGPEGGRVSGSGRP